MGSSWLWFQRGECRRCRIVVQMLGSFLEGYMGVSVQVSSLGVSSSLAAQRSPTRQEEKINTAKENRKILGRKKVVEIEKLLDREVINVEKLSATT